MQASYWDFSQPIFQSHKVQGMLLPLAVTTAGASWSVKDKRAWKWVNGIWG